MMFSLNNDEETFNIFMTIKHNGELHTLSTISLKVESVSEVQIEDKLDDKALAVVIMNFDNDNIEEYGSLVLHLNKN